MYRSHILHFSAISGHQKAQSHTARNFFMNLIQTHTRLNANQHSNTAIKVQITSNFVRITVTLSSFPAIFNHQTTRPQLYRNVFKSLIQTNNHANLSRLKFEWSSLLTSASCELKLCRVISLQFPIIR